MNSPVQEISGGSANARGSMENVHASDVDTVRSNATEEVHSASMSGDQVDQYVDVIKSLRELNVKDDDTKFNRKVRRIMENWKKACKTGEEVEKCFNNVHGACLKDEELASKLVQMTASKTSISQDVNDKNIRFLMVVQLQVDSDNGIKMQKKDPGAFRNSVRMLGEFYNRALLTIDGEILALMVWPLVSSLKLLLAAGSSEDLQLFWTQIFLNGSSIKSAYPEELTELLIEGHKKLVNHPTLSEEVKKYLLKALDMSIRTFHLLPGKNPSIKTLESYALRKEQTKKETTTTAATPCYPVVYYHPNYSGGY